MVPRSLQKQLSNQHSNLDRFWSQLEPILDGFGGQDRAKLAPNRSKNPSSNQSKKWSPFGSLLGAIFIDFGFDLGAKMEPKTLILEPRSAQDPQTWSQDGPRTSNLQPRWHQIAPERLHRRIFINFGTDLSSFLIDFQGFCNPTGLILASISLPFCIHFCFWSLLPDHTPVCRSSHSSPNVEGRRWLAAGIFNT